MIFSKIALFRKIWWWWGGYLKCAFQLRPNTDLPRSLIMVQHGLLINQKISPYFQGHQSSIFLFAKLKKLLSKVIEEDAKEVFYWSLLLIVWLGGETQTYEQVQKFPFRKHHVDLKKTKLSLKNQLIKKYSFRHKNQETFLIGQYWCFFIVFIWRSLVEGVFSRTTSSHF